MKHSFQVFDHILKTFGRDKRLGLDVYNFRMFSYHDQTLELVFHILIKKLIMQLMQPVEACQNAKPYSKENNISENQIPIRQILPVFVNGIN